VLRFVRTSCCVRIVHLTDLHLGPRLGAARWGALSALIDDLPALTGGFERLVITGDVAARGQLRVYRELRTRLAPLLAKVRLVPGNHDAAGCLGEVFSDRMSTRTPAATFFEDLDGVRLIGLDSSRPWRTSGVLGPSQLDWLDRLLDGAAASVVFLHHPPLRVGAWWLDQDRLRDHRAFAEVLRDRGVLGVFCGHVHQEREGRLGVVPVWTTPSTAYQFKPGSWIPRSEPKAPGFRLIEIEGGVLRTSVIRLGRAGTAPDVEYCTRPG